MKKLILFVLLLNSALRLLAQPTITTAQLPYAGLAYINSVDSSFTASIPAGGAMQTWNFSTLLTQDDLDSIGFINASVTPYVNDFPGANLAANSTTDSIYSYFITNANGFYFKGIYFYGSNLPFPVNINKLVFNPANLSVPTPFTYNNTLTSFYRFVLDVDTGGAPYLRIISRTNQAFVADGYGTVQLPSSASYSNCLRIKVTETTYDSVLVDALGFGIYIPFSNSISQSTIYNFLRQAQPSLILSINADSLGTNGLSASWFQGTAITSVSDQQTSTSPSAINVFPNPASDLVMITLPDAGKQNDIFRLFDLQGRVIRETSLEGMNQYGFYVSNLAAGTYMWTVSGREQSGKLIVK